MGFSCLLQGSDTLTIQCGAMAIEAGHDVAAVITRDPRVRDWAIDAGLPVYASGLDVPDSVDWLLSIANVDVIPDPVLVKATCGAINFHDGPLPRYAGLNAPVWALMNGETTHGITWHVIEDGIDEGRIVAQQMFDITPDDTTLTVNAKCFSAAIDCFPKVMDALQAGLADAKRQDLSARSYYGLHNRPFAGGVIDFDTPTRDIVRKVRALYHGDYRNPLSVPKLVLHDRVVLARQADAAVGQGEPGTVLAADTTSVTIATLDGAVRLSDLSDPMGAPVSAGLAPGALVPVLDLNAIDAAVKGTVRGDRRALDRFATYRPAQWCEKRRQAGTVEIALEGTVEHLAFAFAVNIAALSGDAPVDLARKTGADIPGAHLGWHPICIDASKTLGAARAEFDAEYAQDAPEIAVDLPARVPEIDHRIAPDAALSDTGALPGAALTLDMGSATLHADLSRISEAEAQLIAARVDHLAGQLGSLPADTAVSALPLLPAAEREMLLTEWNATEAAFEDDRPIHQLFEVQVDKTPGAIALAYRGETLTYAELDARANRLAHVLRGMGVGPNEPVGLHVRRSTELVVGALGILKAGGAYLPLDPAYPADRIALYIEDSGARVIVGESKLPLETIVETLHIDSDPRLETAPATRPEATATASVLAYMIYTSGSTGRPKGVMIEHRNVSNFFTGMDARVAHDDGSVLMAVTSLSFDISVLELFWTLSRGFKVVVSDEEKMVAGAAASGPAKAMDFSLYYWGNDDGVGQDKYTMLLEGAKFADKNGFCAVWTPERHFHAFGGLYPNPAVTGAAVAAVTENIGVRAGSCVAPLHHPARIAEEWAVIDNLTGGRAGIAFASGWQPDDFVLRPENSPPNNKPALFEALDSVRKLWVGDEVEFAKADGTRVARLTQPRPVSKALNAWVTTAGNPDTWRQAGETGCHVLTHLLGQSIEEVGEKIKIYHEGLRKAGHNPADFTVTLLLHTYIAADRDVARDVAREPMKDYLRSAADLIKQYAWAFPAFKRPEGASTARELDLGSLEKDELEAILDFAFERYFDRSGLFGTVEDALARVEEVQAIGVTEVACLIDYGIERQTVLDGLVPLAEVVRRANEGAGEEDYSLAASITKHGVTHLQCTPYMARMLVTNEDSRAALGGLKHLMIGGEPVSPGLISDLSKATAASIENMYGPTETTIWSTTARLKPGVPVRIGAPIANTQIYVLNGAGDPCPVGVPGEMYIGGAGVARGYHGRDDLTAERFLDDPFRPGNRMFRTGDLARWHDDGQLEFLGRIDSQVKVRGYRIELGEIEAALEAQYGVEQAVVIVRKDASGVGQLTGYFTGDAEIPALKQALGDRLPDFMVPGRIVTLDVFPLTPNKKIDRKALPEPGKARKAEAPKTAPITAPAAAPTPKPVAEDINVGEAIAEIWADILSVDRIGPSDNFFELGGHSLLAVEAHRAVRDRLGLAQLSIADIFRAPTLGGFTARAEALIQPAYRQAGAVHEEASTKASEATVSRRRALRQQRERPH